jgi:DNA-directed RNA polymerase subunit RPC12/RpoP
MQWLRSDRGGGGQGALAVVAIICIGVAAFFIVKQTKPKDEGASGIFYYCTSCEKEFVDSADKVPPIKCPYCKQVTGAYLRKYKCKECGTEFRGYLLKWPMDVKRRKERRKRGEKVPFQPGETELVSPADEEYWVDSESPEGFDIINNIVCPECEASGGNLETIFPKPKKK